MIGDAKATLALEKLLRVARQSQDEATARIADIKAAKASAEASVDWLVQSVREEETAIARDRRGVASPAGADIELMRFTETARNRRAALRNTIETLDAEMETARESLMEAAAEVKKLEQLLEATARRRAKRAQKKEQASMDEAARRCAPIDAHWLASNG